MRFTIIVALVLNMSRPSFEIWRIITAPFGGGGTATRKSDTDCCLKSEFRKGIPEFHIPSMEPFEIPNATIKLGRNEFLWLNKATGSVEIKDLKCHGLTQWNRTDTSCEVLHYFPLTMATSFNIRYENIKCKTDYFDLNLAYKDRNFFGNGKIEFTAKNLTLKLTLDYKVLTKEATGVKIIPSLQRMHSVKITGLNSDPDVSKEISLAILRRAPIYVDDNAHKIDRWVQGRFSTLKKNKSNLMTYLVNKCF